MSPPVDWMTDVERLEALQNKLADIYSNSVYTGSLGTSTHAALYTSAATIGTLRSQGANYASGYYSPFSSEEEAWAAWSDSARGCAADLNRCLGSNDAWDVTNVAANVAKDAGNKIADWGGDAANKALPAVGVGVLVLVLVLAIVVLK